MSAEKFEESPKFDIEASYSRDDFIFRMERLLLIVPANDPFMLVLRKNIEWAQKHDESAVIRWMESPNGDLVPYVEICVPMTDDEFGLDDSPSGLIN